MSSLSPLTTYTFQNAAIASQQEINDILKSLSTGLSIDSASNDPSSLAISDKINSQALDAASTSTNAQNGLTYLQIAQQAYSNILIELDKVKDIANNVLKGSYSDSELQTFQDTITKSINQIKLIEEGTMFNGVQVFNNSNSAGSVNEHMFAITSKTTSVVTTTTINNHPGTDYSSYLAKTVNRYLQQSDGTLVNGVDANLTPGANVVTISNATELIAALDYKNSATAGKTYVLMDNIDLSSLGTQNNAILGGDFEGTFLGNGYAISGANVDNSGTYQTGLFASLGVTAKVQDLVLKDFNIKGGIASGALTALNNTGSIINNVAALNVNVTSYTHTAGGLVGENNGTITNSYTTGKVGSFGIDNVGGLVGNNWFGTISNSFSTADVVGNNYVGGLSGYNKLTTISSSYATGTVSGTSGVGGLLGGNDGGTVTNSYSLGNVSGLNNTAGLVGDNKAGSVISNSYSLSKVTDTTSTYAIANFTTTASGGTVQGLSDRPNDIYNLVYKDGDNKTWAFSSVDDCNKFENSNGAIGQFYELTDAVNNIWTGRTQQADAATYSSTTTGASVENLPDSPYGTFDILYNGNAFSTKADYDAFVAGSGEISLFYNYNSMTSKWDAMKQTLDAGSGDYTYAATAQGVNTISTAKDSSDDYNVIKTIGGANAGTYAFATETDATNFNDGVTFGGNVGRFYKLDTNNTTWAEYNITSGAMVSANEFIDPVAKKSEAQAISDGYDAAHIIHDASEFVSKIGADMTGNFIMVGNIDMSSLGTLTDAAIAGSFEGQLDGNGYSVINLSIDTGSNVDTNIGLFETIGVSGSISNLGVKDATIIAAKSPSVGILAGNVMGSVTNSYTTGSVSSGKDHVGGLAGYSSGTISKSYSTATVTVSGGALLAKTGGFVGTIGAGTISQSYATGTVIGRARVGGFVGGVDGGIISDSYSTGNVTGDDAGVGGFAGMQSGGTVQKSYATGDVSSTAGFKGGFFGYGSSTSCFYINNMSTDSGAAVNGNVSPLPTGTWSTAIWDFAGSLPSLTPVTVSKPNEANYDYSYTSTGGVLGAGTFYFDTVESKNNFISINGGSTASYADIYTYKSNGTTWDLQKISGTITPDTYSVAAEGSASVTSRPDKEGFDVLSADGKAAFKSVADLTSYNNGTYIGAISSFYEYNSTTELWDEKKVTADATSYTVSAAGGTINPGLVARPDASGYTYLHTIATGANAGTYAFDSAADKQSFIDFNAGAPTATPIDNYYKLDAEVITSAAQLQSRLNANLDGNFILGANIDLSTLGTLSSALVTGEFTGKLDGNGYSINNLTIDTAGAVVHGIGLFSSVSGGEVQNLTLTNVSINASKSTDVGALAGLITNSVISNVSSNGVVLGQCAVGGLIGLSKSSSNISNASSQGSVTLSSDGAWGGGLVGWNQLNSIISNSSSSADLTGGNWVGGLVGVNTTATIKSSFATGTVTGWEHSIGGLAGENQASGIITDSYSTGDVAGTVFDSVGFSFGVASFAGVDSSSSITNSYATGNVSAVAGITLVGGFTGQNLNTADANNFYKNNMSASQGNSVDANVSPMPTATWDKSIWDLSGALPVLIEKDTLVENTSEWTAQSLTYNNNVGFLVGKNSGTVTDSVYGSGVASASYVGDDGVQILGNAELANSASTPLNTWDTAVWDLSGSRPTLKNTPAEGYEKINESSLPSFPNGVSYTYSTQDDYSTTYSRLNVALNSYTNTVMATGLLQSVDSITEAKALTSGYDAAHIIHTAAEFKSKISADMAGSFIMVGNIDMSSLGTLTDSAITGTFTGKLDGNGYSVNNLTIDTSSSGTSNIGLFAEVSGSNAEIKNLGVENATITALNNNNVGLLAGRLSSSSIVDNVFTTGTVSGASNVGGLAGFQMSAIKNSSSSATVSGVNSVGGLVGDSRASISASYATGNVSGVDDIGGFAGITSTGAIISNAYSTGDVVVNGGSSSAGGFVGNAYDGVITYSYASGNVTGTAPHKGGFAGEVVPSGNIDATNFYKNNMSIASGYTDVSATSLAVNANVSGMLTSTWDQSVWDFSGSLPALKNTNKPSVTFATNKLISNMVVSNAANSNQIFSEGKDFAVYTNDNGATWKMDILSSAMLGTNIKIDYEGVPTGTADQSTSGFNMYLGDNKNLNIKDMVLDLAGRLNFNVTKDGGAQTTLDAINGMTDYMDVKKLRVDGSIKLATAALSNKTTKSTTFSSEIKTLNNFDEAKQTALLMKEQLNLQNLNDFYNKYSSYNASLAKMLLGYKGYAKVDGGLYSGLTGVHDSSNNAVKDYYYKQLYEVQSESTQS